MSWNDIPGRAAYLWIYDDFVVHADKYSSVVEVGVALGKSISYLARLCLDKGRDDICVIAVDPWAGTARNGEQQANGPPSKNGDWQLFKRTMSTYCPDELRRINKIIRKYSVDAAKKIPPKSLDLVVLDAGHEYEDVKSDIEAWLPKLKLGGYMGGDDWMPQYPGVERAVREMFPDREIEVRHDQDWGTWRLRI